MSLNGKVALVTGGARGIGRAIAERLGSAGADLAIFDVLEEVSSAAEEMASALGVRAVGYRVNVTDAGEVDEAVKKVVGDLGRLDVLVNNAGITRDGLIMRMKDEDWDAVLAVNLKGAFLCTRAASRSMLKQRSGRVINIASVVGLMGNAGQANYAASKAGLIGLTKTCAKEFGSRGVTVNAVAPGYIKTAMTEELTDEQRGKMMELVPLGRLGEVADVVAAVAFLASEDAAYVTG
ncbi:MAG: 3-oxoacyl-[acyl-carrier-protein] reductase [Planctomycetota bacterium]|jgi:3-oxoacyl-[acyl-carrier protein] reductase